MVILGCPLDLVLSTHSNNHYDSFNEVFLSLFYKHDFTSCVILYFQYSNKIKFFINSFSFPHIMLNPFSLP